MALPERTRSQGRQAHAPTGAIVTTAIVLTAFALIWFGLPLRRRRMRRRLDG
jgi:hypothetical protein